MALISKTNPFSNVIDFGSGDQIIVGTFALVLLGDGSDTVTTGDNSTVTAGNGNDVISTGAYSTVTTGSGNSVITIGNNSCVHTGLGNNVVYAGTSGDIVTFVGGTNLVVVNAVAPTSSRDIFVGGFGFDTLQLNMTTTQWLQASTQADVKGFVASTGQWAAHYYNFQSVGINTVGFEQLNLVIDGYAVATGRDNAPIITSAPSSGGVTQTAINAPNDNLKTDSVGGTITFRDFDLADKHVVSVAPVGNNYFGMLTASVQTDSTGTTSGMVAWTYSVANGAIAFLGAGQTLTQTYVLAVSDNQGGTVGQTVTITITGTNDAAVIGAPTVSTVAEDVNVNGWGYLTAAGTISVSDADQGQAGFQTNVTGAVGNLGALQLQANGSYLYYVADSAVQYLGASDTKVDTFTIASLDGTTKQVSFTINGQNDAAMIGAPTVSAVTEDVNVNGWGYLTAAGTISVSDVDQGQAGFQTNVTGAAGNLGALQLQANGAYLYYVADSAVQYLGASDTKVDTFTIASLDGTTKQVAFTIYGQNDAAVIGTPTVTGVTEDQNANNGFLIASGRISISDPDQGQAGFQQLLENTYDGVTVHINGGPGNLGGLNLRPDGGYDYAVANSAVQYLAAGQTKTDTFTVTAIDGTTKQVSFTITGTNDAPVLAADTVAVHGLSEQTGVTGSATNDTASATLAFTDVDLSDTHTVGSSLLSSVWSGGTIPAATATALANALSLIKTDSTGSGAGSVKATFALADNLADFLAAGETLKVVYNVTVSDGTAASTQPVTFTITGTNDAPVLAADTVAGHALSELAGVSGSATNDTASATLAFTDVDLSDTHTVGSSLLSSVWSGGTIPAATATALANALGLIKTDSTGSGAGSVKASFSLADNLADFLAAGETLKVVYNVTVSDGTAASTQPVTFTITGTNDAPVLAADTVAVHGLSELAGVSGSATNDTASATLAFTDVDLSDTHTVGSSLFSSVWSGGTIPAATATALANALSLIKTDSTGSGSGSVKATFALADNLADFLAAGETLKVVYNVTVSDGTAASTQPVTFTITGTNDAPVLAADTVAVHGLSELAGVSGSATNDTATTTLAFTDVDLSDTHTVGSSLLSSVWSGGTIPAATATALANALSLIKTDSTGSGAGSVKASFSLADNLADFLAAGETLKVVYNVTVSDGTAASTQPVTFTITGTNDAPVLAADTVVVHGLSELAGVSGSATNDTASATLAFTDVDLSDTHTVGSSLLSSVWSGGTIPAATATALANALGLIKTDSTGSGAGSVKASFSLADNLADFLAAGETLKVVYNVTVSDGTAASTQPVTFTITGTNDAPVLAADTVAVHGLSELAGVSGSATNDTASATLAFTDVDLSDTHTVGSSLLSSVWSGGTIPAATATALANALSLIKTDSTGSGSGSVKATFALADNLADFLAAGETLKVVYNVTVSDGTAASTQPVTFTITGTNDAPVLAADTVAVHGLSELAGVSGSATNDTATTTLAFTDVDLSDTHTVGSSLLSSVWSGGTIPAATATALANALSLIKTDSTGSGAGSVKASFSLADNLADFLAAGETLKVVYNVTVSDGTAASTQPVTFTITGTNDAPVLAADTVASHVLSELAGVSGSTTNDTASATLAFTDVDLSDTHTVGSSLLSSVWSGGTIPAATATALANALSLIKTDSTSSGAGSVKATFALADNLADFLAAGETLKVVYNVTVSDGTAASTQPVTFTITGTNDAPVLAADTVAGHALSELAGVSGSATNDTASATLAFTDVDLSDTHTVGSSLLSSVWSGGTIPAATATALANALSLIKTDSTGSGAGSVKATFALADNLADFLASGETLKVVYNVTVSDGTAASTQPVTFTITGTNDAPVLAADTVAVHGLTEQTGVTGSATPDTSTTTLAFTDVDLSDTHTVGSSLLSSVWSGGTIPAATATALANALSLIKTDSTGSGAGSVKASFSLADNLADFLSAGQTLTATYNITVSDGAGATSTQPVAFTITGTDDAPVIKTATTVASGSIDVPLTGVTAVGYADLTHGNALVNGLGGSAGFGTLSLPASDDDSSGAINITSVFGAAGLNFFGHTYTSLYINNNGNITFAAANSGYDPTVITGGVNNPIIAPFWADVDTRAGAGRTTPGGTSNGANVVYYNLDAANGVFTITWDDVGYYYSQKDKLDAFQLQLVNEGGGNFDIVYRYENINWTIGSASTGQARAGYSAGNGVNYYELPGSGTQASMLALPTTVGNTGIAGVDVFNVRNGSVQPTTLSQTGKIDFTDVDLSDVHTIQSVTYTGAGTAIGGLTLSKTTDTTGSGLGGEFAWTYSADQATAQRALAAAGGGSKVETFNVVISDGHGGTVTQKVTVTLLSGDNPVVLSGDTAASHAITEIANVTGGTGSDTALATLAFADQDLTDTHSVSQSLLASSWSNGTVPGATQTALASALSLTKVDSTGTGTGSVTATFKLADKLADFLAAGETLTATYNVTVNDGRGSTSTQPVTFTITGTNDAPVLAVDPVHSHALSEQTGVTGSTTPDTTSVTLGFTDADLSDTHTVSSSLATATWSAGTIPTATAAALAGALSLIKTDSTSTGTGSVKATFTIADNLVDGLAAGQTLTATYNVTVTDGGNVSSMQPVTFTITGTNDAPVTSAILGSDLQDGGPITITASYTDPDVGDTHTYSLDMTNTQGAVTNNNDGTFTYDPTGHFAGLHVGQTATDGFNYTVTDSANASSTATAAVTIVGDVPNAFAATYVTGQDDVLSKALGYQLIGANEAYSLQLLMQQPPLSKSGAVTGGIELASEITLADGGAVQVNADNSFTFNPDDAYDYLSAGQSKMETFQYVVSDSHGSDMKTITLDIQGVNDAPLASAITGSDLQDGSPITLTASYTDPDQGDTHTYSIDTTNTLGTVTNNGDGTFAYDPSGQFVGMQVGQTATDSFAYTVTDAAGASSTATATVTIAGDVPLTPNVNFDTDQNTAVTGALPYTLIDSSESYTLSISGSDGILGQISFGGSSSMSSLSHSYHSLSSASRLSDDIVLNNDGTFTFDPHGDFDYLAQGESTDVSFQYQVTDAHGTSTGTISIEVDGVNDAPTVSAPVTETDPAGTGVATVNLLANASDVDSSAVLNAANLTWTEGNGTILPPGTLPPGFSLSPDGNSLTVDTGNSAYASLLAGQTNTADFTYDVTDEHGATVVETASVTIVGTATTDPTTVTGTTGQDVLYGSGGTDIIDGKGGGDLLFGGAGADTFVFQPGYAQNEIVNFGLTGANHDVLDISAFSQFTDLASVIAATTTTNGNATIQLSPSDSVTLIGVTATDLSAHPEDFKGFGGWGQTTNTPNPGNGSPTVPTGNV